MCCLQLKQGKVFNIKDARQALQNIHSLGLFANTEILPSPHEKSEGGLVVEIKLKEMEPKSADVTTEWSIAPGRGGLPTLVNSRPGDFSSIRNHSNLICLVQNVLAKCLALSIHSTGLHSARGYCFFSAWEHQRIK